MYTIKKTHQFQKWFINLKDIKAKARINLRLKSVSLGNFGDHKPLGQNLFELRFFFGSGYRVYYSVKDNQVIFLLKGGDKSSQEKDIKQARILYEALEDNGYEN
jgi:putative addiction module killer protein